MLDIVNFPHLKDPRIGMLIREGRTIYYAHIDGEFPERDTVDEVLLLLGVPSESRPVQQMSPTRLDDMAMAMFAADRADLYAREKPGERGELRNFTVKIVNADVTWQAPGYFVVKARSKRSAISRAREEMRSDDYHHTRRDGRLVYSIVEDH